MTPSGVVATILVFVVVGACVRLGFWQLDRRAQKADRNAAVAERMATAPVALTAPPVDTGGLAYRRATARGSYDNDRSVVLAGRSLHGAPGVHVYTPLLTGDGAILVNRGWVPSRDAASIEIGPLRVDSPVVVEGILMPFPDVEIDPESRPDGFRTTWFRMDGAGIRGQYPYAVAPLYLQAIGPGDGAAPRSREEPPVRLAAPTLDPGPHTSYAIQWFSFAAIFLIGWLVLVLRRSGRAGVGSAERV